MERLSGILNKKFDRITYTEAFDILKNSKPNKNKFEYKVDEWGIDFQSEHERYLVENILKIQLLSEITQKNQGILYEVK